MQPAVLIRLRPLGPWRYGPGDGGRDRLDTLYRSDRLYSAVTIAMKQLGLLEDWLDATARRSEPAVTFTSLFPFQGETLFIPPPISVWPPAPALITAPSATFLSKIRWSAARFVPVTLVESLLLGQNILADQWTPDPQSGCLLRRDRPNTTPFYSVVRRGAAVDRISQSTADVYTAACVEFQPGAGLWTAVRYQDENAQAAWGERVKAAFRLLADAGFGGRRSSGWGASETPEFQDGPWPALLFPKLARVRAKDPDLSSNGHAGSLYWLLSLYSPSSSDSVDWGSGNYEVTVRGGHIDETAIYGRKKRIRLVTEGSVLSAANEPVGAACDVAPDGFEHPVYRSGFAVALKLPSIDIDTEIAPVELPADADAPEPRPCEEGEPTPPGDATPPEQAAAPEQAEPEAIIPPPEPAESTRAEESEPEPSPEVEPQGGEPAESSPVEHSETGEETEREL